MSTSTKSLYQSKELSQWEWQEVKQWLTDNNFSNIISKLEPHNITGYDLFYFTQEQMKLFNISSFHEINRLCRIIHSKVLEYLRISFTYENKNYTYQLDFEPSLTVETLSNTFASSLGIKDQIYLATQDNKILFPYIKIIELLLIEPERYRNLKLFNGKETIQATQPNLYAYPMNQNIANVIKPTTPIQSSNLPVSSLPTGMIPTSNIPLGTMPLVSSALSMKYKNNLEEYRMDKQEKDKEIEMQLPSNKMKEKKNDDIITNSDIGKGEHSFKSKFDSEMKPSAYMQYKMNQKQTNSTIEDQQQGNNTFYNKKLSPNLMNTIGNFSNMNANLPQDNSNIKDVKDSIDNNQTTNYIFNSGELFTYDQLKKNTSKNTIPTSNPQQFSSIPQGNTNKEDIMSYQKKGYQNFKPNPSLNTGPNMNIPSEMPQPIKDKDDYRRFSSEKRNFRTYGANNQQEEDYQPKPYEKFNNPPLEDFSDRFNSEKFNRFSARPQSQTPKLNEINQLPSYGTPHLNYDMKPKPVGNNRNQFEAYNMERKPMHQQPPMQTTSSENDNIDEDSHNQLTQDRVN